MSKYAGPYKNKNGATIISADDFGMDENLAWYAVCDTHGTLVGDTNRSRVAKFATDEFCSCCRGNCVQYADCFNCGAKAVR